MISDVLSEAVSEMDRYLNDPDWQGTYIGAMRLELQALRTLMDAYRRRLDSPLEIGECRAGREFPR